MRPRDVAGPDRGGEAEGGGVGATNELFHVGKLQHREHGAEDLLAGDLHLVLHVGEHRRLDEEAAVAHPLAAGGTGGAFRLARLDVAHDLVELGLVDLRPLLRAGIERIAHASLPALFDHPLHKLAVDFVLDEEPRAGAAALALVEKDPHVGPSGGGLQVGVGEHDVGALPAEFEGQPLQLVSGLTHDDLSGLARAREGHLVDAGMLDDRGPRGGAESRHHVDHPVGHTRLLGQPRQPQGRQRGLLGRLHHDRAAGGKGRAPLPRHHQDRKVPGNDLPGHAHRFPPRVTEVVAVHRDCLALDLVSPSGVVAERVEGERDVSRAGVAHRLAVVERLERREFIDLGLDQVGESHHDPAAVAGVHSRPRSLVKRLPSGADGEFDIGGVTLRHLGDHFLRGRVERLEGLATPGGHPLTVDEQLRLADLGGGSAARHASGGHKKDAPGR